ncbi:hypothetical protein [uncultured Sulfitobacter sp.]|uniref:hypothetical protein n=1 Tax=uncultured Sulfitobacter sp. TaxID=191468 RepID=UPI002598292A|nr:hypothetical protein [uncultured Sulfitobacter sp.]
MCADQVFRNQFLQGENRRFAPLSDLSDKRNYSRHVFIERDGSLSEAVRLNILNDRHREDIIGFHFAQQYAKIHFGDKLEQPQFYIVGRDNPWDIEYVMHDGTTFFLEICRVADKDLLKAIKIENDVTALLMKSELKGFEIEKIEKHFPGTLPVDLVAKVQNKADKQRRYVLEKPGGGPDLFLRPPMDPHLNLKTEIEIALKKKSAKKHAGKDRTIIVLDNLTTHSQPEDFFDAVNDLGDFLDELPFKSVWLYTGYYSDDDGYSCEYSLVPIKLSDEEASYLTEHGPR